MVDLEHTANKEHSKLDFVREYFRFVKDQFEESKEKDHEYKGYYFSNCLRVLVGMESHRTAPGSSFDDSWYTIFNKK